MATSERSRWKAARSRRMAAAIPNRACCHRPRPRPAVQTDSLDLALTVALQTICEAAGWVLGEASVPEVSAGADVRLTRAATWTSPGRRLQVFLAQGSGFRFSPGEGLPGAAWTRREPIWENSLSSGREFTRGALAAAAGLRAAVAIPIVVRGEPIAVMSCYMTEPPADDATLTRIARAVASQVGPLLQQKKAEEARRNAEAQLAGTIAIAADAIISVDEARRISLFNWGAERIFGYTAEEALGQSLDMLLPEDRRERHATEIAHFATSAQTARRIGGAVRDRRPSEERRDLPGGGLHLPLSGWRSLDVHSHDA